MSNENDLYELPNSWKWVKLGEILQPSSEKIDPLKTEPTIYIGLEHIERDTGKLLGYGNSIEVRSLKDIKLVLSKGGINRILIDNFTPQETKEAIQLIGNKFDAESSGGINEKNIAKYAASGVGFISVGALTHQVKSLDLSLKAVK